MFRKQALSLWVLPLLALMFTVAAFGQTTASIKGTVTDPTGAAVVGAKVTVRGVGVDRTVQTNTSGDYEVLALPPGTYTVDVQIAGFQAQQAKDLVLPVSSNAVQNFALKVATANETVTVEATAAVIETTTMTVGQTIDQRTVQDIPLNGRHFVDLSLLIPGTVTPPQNGFLTAPLRGQGSFAFNSAGGREDAVNFMINGINLNDMLQNQVTFQPTINTVSEFKIDNSTYSAEYGRNSGSIVNIATRSGSDQFHGEMYDYLRNNYFDARNAFDRKFSTSGAPLAMPPFKRNQFGADLGGPLHKGKTYFFLSYEGLRHRQGLTTTGTVFTEAQRTAIQTGGNAVSNALLGLVPHPNTIIGTSAVPNGFIGSATAPVDIDQGTADINHTISDKDTLHGYYVYQNDLRGEPTQGANIPGFGDTRAGHRQVLTLNESHVFGSNTVNEVRLGANRVYILFKPQNTTDPTSLGLGTTLGTNETVLPVISVSDISLTFGSERNFPQGRGDTTFVLADTLSMVRGRHSFKFGGEARDFRNNNFNSDPGTLVFTVASFTNGAVTSAARTLGNVANRINAGALDFFGQDSWKVSSKLTLELGVRYAWNMTPSEAKDRFSNLVPVVGTGSLLIPASQPYAQNNKNIEPRVGFAFNMFKNTVLRGGYGYQVDQPLTGFVNGLNANPPFALPISVQGTTAVPTVPLSSLSGSFSATSTPGNIAPLMVNPNLKNAYAQSWNLNLQQEVTHSLGVMVGYFGSKGTHLEVDRNVNQFTTLGSSATRPFLQMSTSSPILPSPATGAPITLANNITERDSSAKSNYHALWVTANKRMSHGLQFNASYTWSHSIDDVSRNLNGVVVQDSTNIFNSRGNSDFDARHRVVGNAIYDLPFKSNRFVSGWSLAPIASYQTGNPFNIVVPSGNITGVTNSVRPNVVGPIVVTGNPFGQWIAPSNNSFAGTFAIPTTSLGNMGRNSIVGPGFTNVDLALIKNTKVTEKVNVQFRADAFDLLNHPNYGQPARILSALGTPGAPLTQAVASEFTITSTRFPTGDSGSSRQLQLALKLLF